MWSKSGIWTVYVQSGENAYRTLNRRLYCKLFSSKIWWDDEKQHVFQLYEALFVFDMVSCLVDLSADSRHHDRFLPLSTPSLSSVSSLMSVCLQHTLTMQFFFLSFFFKTVFKVENKLKLCLAGWHCLASITAKMYEHFLLFSLGFLCSQKDRVWVFNPISHFKQQTHPEFLSNTVIPVLLFVPCWSERLTHILLLLFSLVFPFWLVGGRAWSFITQASLRAVTAPSSAEKEQNQQNVLMSVGRPELGVTAMDARHFWFKILVATFSASLINLNVLRNSRKANILV